MPIHRKIITLISLGMFLFMAITMLSLLSIVTTFSSIAREVERTTGDTQRIATIQKTIETLSDDIHNYIALGDERYGSDFNTARNNVHASLDMLASPGRKTEEQEIVSLLRVDAGRLELKADQIFPMNDPSGRDRFRAHNVATGIDDRLSRINAIIENRVKGEYTLQNSHLADCLYFQKERIIGLFTVILLLSLCFLIGFSMYIYRKVADPLMALGKGASEISRGNLEYSVRLAGTCNVAQLGERFNDMAAQLKHLIPYWK
jgi:CHASE3 domain sensor protein